MIAVFYDGKCTLRERKAYEAGAATRVRLEAMHEKAVKCIRLETLKKY